MYLSKRTHPVSFKTVQPDEGFFFLAYFHPKENLAAQLQIRQFHQAPFAPQKPRVTSNLGNR